MMWTENVEDHVLETQDKEISVYLSDTDHLNCVFSNQTMILKHSYFKTLVLKHLELHL